MHRSIAALIAMTAAVATISSPARAQQDVSVDAAAITSLDTKLRTFARTLPTAEQRVLAGLLRGAAGAPADNPAAVMLAGHFVQRGASGIVVQGGRTASGAAGGVEAIGPKQDDPRVAGRTGAVAIGPKQDDPRVAGRTGAVAIGPKQDDPRAPGRTGAAAIGPKQDDPRAPGRTGAAAIGPKQDDPRAPGRTGAAAIGPKQDDPRAPVLSRLRSFAAGLTVAEAATLDWVVTRALSRPDVGGIPPEEGPSVAEALGVVAIGANGPERGAPTPPPAGFKATLRM